MGKKKSIPTSPSSSKDEYHNLETSLTMLKKRMEEETNKHLPEIGQLLSEKKLCLCLGAGITRQLIGDWSTLLREIATARFLTELYDNGNPEDVQSICLKDMRKCLEESRMNFPESIGVLEAGEYLSNIVWEGDQQPTASSNTIWQEFVFAAQTLAATNRLLSKNLKVKAGKDWTEKVISECVKLMEANDNRTKTLEAVLFFCCFGEINYVINYNFDLLFDRLLASEELISLFEKKYGKDIGEIHIESYSPFPCSDSRPKWEKKTSGSDKSRLVRTIRIDHGHGILDSDLPLDPIIFSESSYFSAERSTLNWNNVKIAEAFMKGSILCVGFSGEDMDFRTTVRRFMEGESMGMNSDFNVKPRIFLVTSLKSRIRKIYASTDQQIQKIKEQAAKLGLLVSEGTKPTMKKQEAACIEAGLRSSLKMMEKYYSSRLNTCILWAKDYEDIPRLLSDIMP